MARPGADARPLRRRGGGGAGRRAVRRKDAAADQQSALPTVEQIEAELSTAEREGTKGKSAKEKAVPTKKAAIKPKRKKRNDN
jgi:hypothetical protein